MKNRFIWSNFRLLGGLGTDNIEFNGEFPLRRSGSDSSLKSSVSTISSFSYASAERTIQARSYHGSSRKSYASDIESILDDLEKCQEESSVDPDITDDFPNASDDIPINYESRALSLDKKPNTRMNTAGNMNSPKRSQVNISQNINSPALSEIDGLKFDNSSPFLNNNTIAPPEVSGSPLSPSSSSGKPSVSSPISMNGHANEHWENPNMMANSPVVDRTSFPFPAHFRDTSDSVDSESSTSVSSPVHKTPGSINLMQKRVNGVRHNRGDGHGVSNGNGVDRSPQMRRGNLRRGFNAVEHEVDLSYDVDKTRDITHDQDALAHQKNGTTRYRSVSFDSVVDSDDTGDSKDCRPNDVETFHALIQNTRGTRRTVYTRGDKSNMNKRFSKSEEILQSAGQGQEQREIFSMELDTDTNGAMSDRPRDSDVTSGISSSSSVQDTRLQNGTKAYAQAKPTRRKLKSEYLASLKNLQASSC